MESPAQTLTARAPTVFAQTERGCGNLEVTQRAAVDFLSIVSCDVSPSSAEPDDLITVEAQVRNTSSDDITFDLAWSAADLGVTVAYFDNLEIPGGTTQPILDVFTPSENANLPNEWTSTIQAFVASIPRFSSPSGVTSRQPARRSSRRSRLMATDGGRVRKAAGCGCGCGGAR